MSDYLRVESASEQLTTTFKEIDSLNDKFDWQKDWKDICESNTETGLDCVMSRTGTGKTKAQWIQVMSYCKQGKNSCTIFYPNNLKKTLGSQIHSRFIKYAKEEPDINLLSNEKDASNGIFELTIEKFKCIIKPFVHNSKRPDELYNHDKNNPIIIDEFDGIQTQLGLSHGGTSNQYCQSNLESHVKQYEKTEFNILQKICKKTKITGYSASFEETISHDLRPYEEKIKIQYFIVNHKKKHFDTVPIKYKSSEDLLELIPELYSQKNRTLIFVNNTEEMKELEKKLNNLKIPYYSWNYTKGNLDSTKISKNYISIFINGPTRGLDIQDIKSVILYRKLNASTKNNTNLLSNLAIQIMGRIRKGGCVYWEYCGKKEKEDEEYYDLNSRSFEEVKNQKYDQYRKFIREINRKHLYDSDYINNIVRLFINNYVLKKINITDNDLGDSILRRFNDKFRDDQNFKIIQNKFKDEECENFDNEFIDKYIELEKVMVEEYKKAFISLVGNSDEVTCMFEKPKHSGNQYSGSNSNITSMNMDIGNISTEEDIGAEAEEDLAVTRLISENTKHENTNGKVSTDEFVNQGQQKVANIELGIDQPWSDLQYESINCTSHEPRINSDSEPKSDQPKNINNDIDSDDEPISKSCKSNINTTGGGSSKLNIFNDEREKGEKCLELAIYDLPEDIEHSHSAIKNNTHKKQYEGKFMHAVPKSELNDTQRTESKKALPIVDPFESGINDYDTNTEVLEYDEIKGMRINYDKLKRLIPNDLDKIRPESDINLILERYHDYQQKDLQEIRNLYNKLFESDNDGILC